nr:addiction module protein [Oceanococcus sp. HetDA_MAG_MS8]
MTTPAETIENAALSLPVRDRTRLVVHLLESIDQRGAADPQEIERTWAAEANRRYQAYLQGEEEAIPSEQVFSELRAEDH